MEISDKEIIKKIFENRAEVIEGHDPWRYGSDLAELTDKVEIDWIMKNLPIDSSRLMLDVGCGTGRHVLELANHKKSLMIFSSEFFWLFNRPIITFLFPSLFKKPASLNKKMSPCRSIAIES